MQIKKHCAGKSVSVNLRCVSSEELLGYFSYNFVQSIIVWGKIYNFYRSRKQKYLQADFEITVTSIIINILKVYFDDATVVEISLHSICALLLITSHLPATMLFATD